MKSTEKLAESIWNQIKSNLEDRSVLHLGDVDEETLNELKNEQIAIILDSLDFLKDLINIIGKYETSS